MASHRSKNRPGYFVPEPSAYPIALAGSLLVIMLSLAFWLNEQPWAPLTLGVGVAALAWVLKRWFGQAAQESEGGFYGRQVDLSFRWSMAWFIGSEAMFFATLFGALFYARLWADPVLGHLQSVLVKGGWQAVWPLTAPSDLIPVFEAMTPLPIPTINTALLLSSGVTLTFAHHALRADHRQSAIGWLAATIGLGFLFVLLQGLEYFHAHSELNLTLRAGMYGSLFFLLTGFHGLHVILGLIMLSTVLLRLTLGHFNAQHHFAFEGAAWYWHFVDVVWLGLYLLIYWF